MGDIKITVTVKGLGAEGKDQIGHFTVVAADDLIDAWGPTDLVARAVDRAAEATVAELRRLGVRLRAPAKKAG